MELFVGALLLLGLFVFIFGLAAAYSQTWETTWRGHQIRIVNRAVSEELWIDGVLAERKVSYGMAFSQLLDATLEDPELGSVPVRARIHMDNGISMGCELVVGGVPVALADPRSLSNTSHPEPETEASPSDARWSAASKLLAKVRKDAGEEEERLVAAADDLQRALRRTLLALEHLDEAAEAHAALGGDGDGLALVRGRWEARGDELMGAIRSLHLAVVSRDVVGPTPAAVVEAEGLLGRLAAEAEVEAVQARLAVEEPQDESRRRSTGQRQTTGS